MNRNLIRWIGAPLVLLLITVLVVSIWTLGREPIKTSEEFIDRLEEEYRRIEDF